MARKPPVIALIYVVDTSYLLELFAVPTFYDTDSRNEIMARFAQAAQKGAMLFVPLPCIFELADHINDVKDGSVRKTLAQKLYETIKRSLEKRSPWIITPSITDELLKGFSESCREFAEYNASRGIGLTNCFVANEANRIKKKYSGGNQDYRVHIWTKHRNLKALEPDGEPESFTG
jgi:hypothetical protein